MVHERSEPPEKETGFESVGQIAERMFGGSLQNWKAPRSASELHERVCRAAETIGADPEVLYRQTKAAPIDLARWLAFVEGRIELLRAVGHRLCTELRGETERAVHKCAKCMDTAYLEAPPTARGNSTSSFCECDAGLGAEAGYWWHVTHPWNERAKKRVHDPRKDVLLERYCKAKGKDYEKMVWRIKGIQKRYLGRTDEESW